MARLLGEIKCPCCGGIGTEDDVCVYCGQPNISLSKLSKLIGHNDFESYYNVILNSISSGNVLNEIENEVLSILINSNAIIDEQLLCNLVIKEILLGKKVVHYENFEEIIKRFCQNIMININNGRIQKYFPKCLITKLKDMHGCAFDTDTVALDENRVNDFYNGMLEGLKTIFHELNHIKQNIDIKTGLFSPAIMRFIKEKIIRLQEGKNSNSDEYYKENYDLISFEKDANVGAINDIIWYLNILGLYIIDMNQIEKEISEEINKYNEELRSVKDDNLYEGSSATIDEIFLSIIQDNPKYLQDYPQLMAEYILEDGHVRKKNTDELKETLIQNLDNDNIYNYLMNILDETAKKEKGESYS